MDTQISSVPAVTGREARADKAQQPAQVRAGAATPAVCPAPGVAAVGRSVPEWIGATPDTPIPPRVRLRVFEAAEGVCALTGVKIWPGDAWDVDHRLSLALGGENRESNLQPVLQEAHRKKTARDVAAKAKAARVRKKHLGIESPGKQRLPGGKGSKWKRTVGGKTVLREGN